jgi:hypothetical protein
VHQLREWSGREGAGHGSRSKPEVVLWCLVVSTSRGRVSPGRIDKLIISTGKEKDDAPKKDTQASDIVGRMARGRGVD